MKAVAEFFIENRPKYPGPVIVSDDDGQIGVQWKVKSDQSPDEDEPVRRGLLYLKFYSKERVNCFCTLRSSRSAETFRLDKSVGLDEIMDLIEPFVERLDW